MKILLLPILIFCLSTDVCLAQQPVGHEASIKQATINATVAKDGTVSVVFNGMFQTSGDCSANTPVYFVQKKEDGKWPQEPISFAQMCCGLPSAYAHEYKVILNKSVTENGYTLKSGRYRIAALDDSRKEVFSNAFVIE